MSSRRSARSTAIALPRVPEPPRVPPFVPAWAVRDNGWVHHESNRPSRWVTMVLDGQLRIPRFQRSWKWSDAQILFLLDSVLRGDHVGSLLLWERYSMPASIETFGEVTVESAAGRCSYVIDGQQRLSALVTAMHSGRFYLNLEDGTFSTCAGPWHLPVGMAFDMKYKVVEAWVTSQHEAHGLDKERLWECYAAGVDKMGQGVIGATVLPYAWTIDRVVETFGRINSTGTPFDPDELRLALAKELSEVVAS